MAVTKIIEVVGRSSTSSDDAVKSALVEASRSLRNIKALDVVSVGLRGDNMDEWGALVRISFLVDSVNELSLAARGRGTRGRPRSSVTGAGRATGPRPRRAQPRR